MDKPTVWLLSLVIALIPISIYLALRSYVPVLPGDWWRFWETASTTIPAEARTLPLSGRVVLAPICPVERMPADPACAPRPLSTTVTVRKAGGSEAIASAITGSEGAFRFYVTPGTYEVRAAGGNPFPSCPAVVLPVAFPGPAPLEILCDTGIR